MDEIHRSFNADFLIFLPNPELCSCHCPRSKLAHSGRPRAEMASSTIPIPHSPTPTPQFYHSIPHTQERSFRSFKSWDQKKANRFQLTAITWHHHVWGPCLWLGLAFLLSLISYFETIWPWTHNWHGFQVPWPMCQGIWCRRSRGWRSYSPLMLLSWKRSRSISFLNLRKVRLLWKLPITLIDIYAGLSVEGGSIVRRNYRLF